MSNNTFLDRSGFQWSDPDAVADINRKGYVAVPTVTYVPVGDADISDADVAFMEEQAAEHADRTMQAMVAQSRHIADTDVTPLDPRSINAQELAADKEIYAFAQQVVIAETASAAAVEIAKQAYIDQNWLALDPGTWDNWVEQAMIEVQRNRKLADQTVMNMRSQIKHALPALLIPLRLTPITTEKGTLIDADYVAKHPAMLKHIGPMAKSLLEKVQQGDAEAVQTFTDLVSTYADGTLGQVNAFIRGSAREDDVIKQQLVKEYVQEVDQETGEIKTVAEYRFRAPTSYLEHWTETQLSANYEVAIQTDLLQRVGTPSMEVEA